MVIIEIEMLVLSRLDFAGFNSLKGDEEKEYENPHHQSIGRA